MEQLINKETAYLAKEKGFDLYQENFYLEKHDLCKIMSGEFSWMENEEDPYYDCNGDFEEAGMETRAEAPPQSVLQKWLRDSFGLHIVIMYFSRTISPLAHGYCAKVDQINPKHVAGKGLKEQPTYEEALELALVDALNKITLEMQLAKRYDDLYSEIVNLINNDSIDSLVMLMKKFDLDDADSGDLRTVLMSTKPIYQKEKKIQEIYDKLANTLRKRNPNGVI